MDDTPVHECLRPRLRDLALTGERAGFERDIVVANDYQHHDRGTLRCTATMGRGRMSRWVRMR